MEMKINKNIYLKLIAVLLCIYIAISSFCQPKKVYANPVLLGGIAITLIAGMIAAGYARDAVVPAERLNELNEQATANLQAAFPDPAEYNKQLGILENLSNDLLAGKDIDWSKYSGKAIYAISKAVIDTLYPATPDNIDTIYDDYSLLGTYDHYAIYVYLQDTFTENGRTKYKLPYFPTSGWIAHADNSGAFVPAYYNSNGNLKKYAGYKIQVYDFVNNKGMYYVTNINSGGGLHFGFGPDYREYYDKSPQILSKFLGFLNSGGNSLYRPSLTKQMPSKLKLPTRLPPSVINNYNTYINGDSENLTINPTVDELPQLPENYNPITDDPPDLDGYQDVTPDQEPTDTPDPTPTPTPTPSTPEYDGSSWIKPIGDFFAGLLSFLKDALIPTQTVDFSPLQNMGTDFGKKFPFSLPGDIGKLFGVLQAEPRRPEFQMTFDLSKVGVPGDPIVWDLKFEQWDGAAAIVKTALYIGFLIGLVFISKNFMKN